MRHTTRFTILNAVLATGLVLCASQARADVSLRLTEQGRLFDSTGQPVTGATVALTFAIYSAATGGTAIWTESLSVALDNGYYSAQLGAKTPLPTSLWSSAGTKYLGLTVGTDPEMTPREEMTSVPYAFVALDAPLSRS
jgi:hypothetical protein